MGHCALAGSGPPEGLLFPTVSGTGLQEASDTASLLRIRNTCSWHFVFSHLLNSRDRLSSEAKAEQEWPAVSPLFVWQGWRQCSGQPGAPAVWRSATPAVSLGEVRQRPLWSQVGKGHPGDQTAAEVQRVCRSMNRWLPLRGRSYKHCWE